MRPSEADSRSETSDVTRSGYATLSSNPDFLPGPNLEVSYSGGDKATAITWGGGPEEFHRAVTYVAPDEQERVTFDCVEVTTDRIPEPDGA